MPTKEQIDTIKYKITVAIEHQQVYKNPYLSLTYFAASLNVSYGMLSDIIKEEYGMGFRMYLNNIRISKVLEEIERHGTTLKVSDYARLVGFSSRVTFFNAFKSRMGISLMNYLTEIDKNNVLDILEENRTDKLDEEELRN